MEKSGGVILGDLIKPSRIKLNLEGSGRDAVLRELVALIPETQDCAGWTVQGIEALYDKVTIAWEPYGHLASRLPQEMRERHARIYAAAIEKARAQGWDPELGEDD